MAVHNVDHAFSAKSAKFVFAARLIQVTFGTLLIGLTAGLMVYWVAAYGLQVYDYPDTWTYRQMAWTLLPATVFSSMTVLVGAIGLFAHKRPNDIHWHLTLGLDWFAFAISLANLPLSTVLIPPGYYDTIRYVAIPTTIVALIVFLASLVPIIRTHRLKKRGMLPPRNSPKENWYLMEDAVSAYQRPSSTYPSSTQQPSNYVHQPSQAASRAGTTARWSGVTDETAFNSMRSETEAPPYSEGSARSVKPYV
ncbi:uncharacterized protein LTR77_003878 [Saxophila tyrrhenica]|uniref:Uncharacterized protein n=1 Tax=Saxophila tyrrhenica TaxID=1690608 RepID=A0AAV9PFK3_9PEZI|nr:hypothetical protein LTR77_003878 [Saxophila tyrrhenica]